MMYFQNKTFDEITLGDSASCSHVLTREDIMRYAAVSGDYNPFHVDDAFAKDSRFGGVVAHGMWTAGLFSKLLGTELPGPGTIYTGQTLEFMYPVRVGDTVTATVTAKYKAADKPIIEFDCLCVNQSSRPVLRGKAVVLAPTEKLRIKKIEGI